MCGVIPMSCKMNDSLRTVGYVTAKALSDNVVAKKGEELRGHEFHFSSAEPDGEIPRAFLFTKNRTGEKMCIRDRRATLESLIDTLEEI